VCVCVCVCVCVWRCVCVEVSSCCKGGSDEQQLYIMCLHVQCVCLRAYMLMCACWCLRFDVCVCVLMPACWCLRVDAYVLMCMPTC